MRHRLSKKLIYTYEILPSVVIFFHSALLLSKLLFEYDLSCMNKKKNITYGHKATLFYLSIN